MKATSTELKEALSTLRRSLTAVERVAALEEIALGQIGDDDRRESN
jgi:hypothetical protein